MKFMPNRDLDVVTSSLNFSTPDLHVVGGCDIYTTKAAGGDKKLYKNIENGLEAQYKSNLQFSKSLSPPQKHLMASSLNLSRNSPFGNLGMVSSRRTYAYLIATLNASHPHYDFSHVLRPTDFKREKHLRHVVNTLDTTMYNLRPRPFSSHAKDSGIASAQPSWGPAMWRLVDQQMSLRECEMYRYAPEDVDPFEDDEEGSIWSLNYFFFNKARKRVCYLYLRGISVLSVPSFDALRTPIISKRFADEDLDGWLTPDMGASKRAKYWLGDRDDVEIAQHEAEDEHENADMYAATASFANDGTPTKTPVLAKKESSEEQESRTEDEQFGPPARPVVDEHDNYLLSDEEMRSLRSRSKSTARGISEEMVGPIEV